MPQDVQMNPLTTLEAYLRELGLINDQPNESSSSQSIYQHYGMPNYGTPDIAELPPTRYGPEATDQQLFRASILAKQKENEQKFPNAIPPPRGPMGPSPEQIAEVARARAVGNTPQMQKEAARRAEAQQNIGPGAVEFAPGQFYKGPESVSRYYNDKGQLVQGAGRKDSFSNRPGSAPLRNPGRGTLTMDTAGGKGGIGIRDEQGNPKEILPSNPRARRQVELDRAQQQAALAQAEATERAYKQQGQAEPQPPEDAVANLILQGLIQKYQRDGDIAAFTKGLNQLFQTMRRFSPDQIYAPFGAATQSEG